MSWSWPAYYDETASTKDCWVTKSKTIDPFHEIFASGTTRQQDVKDLWFITNSFRVTMNLLSWSRWYWSLPISLSLYRLPFPWSTSMVPKLPTLALCICFYFFLVMCLYLLFIKWFYHLILLCFSGVRSDRKILKHDLEPSLLRQHHPGEIHTEFLSLEHHSCHSQW